MVVLFSQFFTQITGFVHFELASFHNKWNSTSNAFSISFSFFFYAVELKYNCLVQELLK